MMRAAMVDVTVTSNVQGIFSERRFPRLTTIKELRDKCELLTGIPSSSIRFELKHRETGKTLTLMDEDSKTLADYNVQNGLIIHVIDTCGSGIAVDNNEAQNVEKYVMSDEVYAARGDSVKAWKESLGVTAKTNKQERMEELIKEGESLADRIQVGQRCEVTVRGQPTKRGVVAYVGKVHFKPGSWIGVQYDEPFGKNNGSVDGQAYFNCPDKYGGFVRPQDVQVGEFPPEADDMDEF